MIGDSVIKKEWFDWSEKKCYVDKKFLKGCKGFTKVVDLDDLSWQNDTDTIVFMITGDIKTVREMYDFIEIFDSHADELDVQVVEGKVVVRLWWD